MCERLDDPKILVCGIPKPERRDDYERKDERGGLERPRVPPTLLGGSPVASRLVNGCVQGCSLPRAAMPRDSADHRSRRLTEGDYRRAERAFRDEQYLAETRAELSGG